MVLVIVITKEGLFKNEIVNDLQQLYKCCNYKSNKGFIKLYEWDNYELWGKIKGKISNEILQKIISDNFLLHIKNLASFGLLCVCKKNEDLTLDEWNKLYNDTNNTNHTNDTNDTDNTNFKLEEEIVESDYVKENNKNDDLYDELVEELYD